jgi:hypothetical protein
MHSYTRQLHKLAIQSDPKTHLNTSTPQRTDKTALADPHTPWLLRLWCAVVGLGSGAAVVLARRV